MDLAGLVGGVLSFLWLLVPLSIISFVAFSIFSPLRERLAKRYGFSWLRSCFVLNFLVVFALLLLAYIYFMATGFVGATPRDPDLEYNLVDTATFVLIGAVRVFVVSIILASFLLFFEMVASFFMEINDKPSGKVRHSAFQDFVGVLVASAVFLFLFLFFFSWVPLGLLVFIFYGSIKPLPLFFLI